MIGAARWSTVCFLLDEASALLGGVGGGSGLTAVHLLIGSVEPEPETGVIGSAGLVGGSSQRRKARDIFGYEMPELHLARKVSFVKNT